MERSITHGKPTDKNCQNAQNAQNAHNALCAHGLGGHLVITNPPPFSWAWRANRANWADWANWADHKMSLRTFVLFQNNHLLGTQNSEQLELGVCQSENRINRINQKEY